MLWNSPAPAADAIVAAGKMEFSEPLKGPASLFRRMRRKGAEFEVLAGVHRVPPSGALESSFVGCRFSRMEEPERFVEIVVEFFRSRRPQELAPFERRDSPSCAG